MLDKKFHVFFRCHVASTGFFDWYPRSVLDRSIPLIMAMVDIAAEEAYLLGWRVDARDHEVKRKQICKESYIIDIRCVWIRVEIVKSCQELQDLKKKHAKHLHSTTIQRSILKNDISGLHKIWLFIIGEVSHRFCDLWGTTSIYAESDFVAPVLAPGRWESGKNGCHPDFRWAFFSGFCCEAHQPWRSSLATLPHLSWKLRGFVMWKSSPEVQIH